MVGLGDEVAVFRISFEFGGIGFVKYGDAMDEASSTAMLILFSHVMIFGGFGGGFDERRGGAGRMGCVRSLRGTLLMRLERRGNITEAAFADI